MTALRTILTDPALRLTAIAMLTFGGFAAALAPYQSLLGVRWFGFSDATYSAIYATGAALSLICAVGVGVVTDRTGRRRNAARLAAGAGLVGALLVFVVDARWAYAITHLIFFPLSSTLFAQLFTLARLGASTHPPASRGGLQAAIRAFFAIPFVALLPLLALAFAAGLPLLYVYLICAVSAGITLAIFLIAWPADGRTRWTDAGSGLSLRAALQELAAPAVLTRTGALAVVLAGIQLYLVLTGLILTAADGRSTSDVAVFFGIVAGLEIPVMLMLGAPLARFGPGRMIAGAAVLHAGFIAVFPLLGATPLVWALPAVAAAGAAVILTVPMQYLQDLLGSRPGAGGSLIALCNLGAQIVGAALFALGTWIGDYATVAWIGAPLVAVAGLSLLWLDRSAAA